MASFTLQIVPGDSNFKPTNEGLTAAAQILKNYLSYLEGDIRIRLFSKPMLIDSGAAFEKLYCPKCGALIDRFGDDDHNEWWDSMETGLYDSLDPLQLRLKMPCCGSELLPTELDFGKDACFAYGSLSASEYELPDGNTRLSDAQISAVSSALGCPANQIVSVG